MVGDICEKNMFVLEVDIGRHLYGPPVILWFVHGEVMMITYCIGTVSLQQTGLGETEEDW